MCFVFKTAVVFLCKERLRQKKKSIMPVSEFLLAVSHSIAREAGSRSRSSRSNARAP